MTTEHTRCRHDATVTTGIGNREVACPPWCAWQINPAAADIIYNAILERLHGDASGAEEAVQQAIAHLADAWLLAGTNAVPADPQPGPPIKATDLPQPLLLPAAVAQAAQAHIISVDDLARRILGDNAAASETLIYRLTRGKAADAP